MPLLKYRYSLKLCSFCFVLHTIRFQPAFKKIEDLKKDRHVCFDILPINTFAKEKNHYETRDNNGHYAA